MQKIKNPYARIAITKAMRSTRQSANLRAQEYVLIAALCALSLISLCLIAPMAEKIVFIIGDLITGK